MFANKVKAVAFNALEKIEYGALTLELPNAEQMVFTGKYAGANAHFRLNDFSVLQNMQHSGDVALAHDYQLGKWDSHDLTSLFVFALQNYKPLKGFIQGGNLQKFILKLGYFFKRNSKQGSKKNIHAHYDLGNEFYQAWLDPSMSYSAGLFHHQDQDLQTAQFNKYDRLLDHIGGQSKSILEIGCGWGGFAQRAVERHDHRLYGVTISDAQYDYAQTRLQDKAAQVTLAKQDYRDIDGKFDGIVSIEMFEAVGMEYWATYFDKIKSMLSDKGTAMIQTITIADDAFDSYVKSGDAIRSYIFPGGMLPSQQQFEYAANKAGLAVKDKFLFGQDYAKTMKSWSLNFENALPKIKEMGFDDPFIRLWRFYLTYCEAAFLTQRTSVMQVELGHAR